MPNEHTPLLSEELGDVYEQFCHLVGTRPKSVSTQKTLDHPGSLYARAIRHRSHQTTIYAFTAALSNTLLLTQVILGAALTGLGASNSSPVLVTIFGALNTVIAGLIAFLKSRGLPMRSKMFRDDLDRVVDEIENSAVMWLGISKQAHGYNAIDTDDEVTVRGEVARLTRLYDRAVKINTMNDPDNYAAGGPSDPHSAALRIRPTQAAQPAANGAAASVIPAGSAAPVAAVIASVAADPDESPATKPPEPKDESKPVEPPKTAVTPSEADKKSTSPEAEGSKSHEPNGPNDSAADSAVDMQPGEVTSDNQHSPLAVASTTLGAADQQGSDTESGQDEGKKHSPSDDPGKSTAINGAEPAGKENEAPTQQ